MKTAFDPFSLMAIRERLIHSLEDGLSTKYSEELATEIILMIIANTKERITLNIMDRVTDLKTCGKDDNCYEFGDLIESYIKEWMNEDENTI
jgi:hypothetical protein